MSYDKFRVLAGCFLGLAAVALASLRAADEPPDADEEFLKESGIGTDGPSLLEYLRRRSPTDVEPRNLKPLIRQLGSDSVEERETASQVLGALGLCALEALGEAMKDPDAERAHRAGILVQILAQDHKWSLPLVGVRRLATLRPTGTVQVLLRYLPYAADEKVTEEIWYALDALAIRDGEPDAAIVGALTDDAPERRAVAACILGRRGNTDQRAAVRKLLNDVDALVRLRAAQGLLAANDKTAIPVLIELLRQPSVEISWQAEELLRWVAGQDSPRETVGAGASEARRRCQSSWVAWWRRDGGKLQLDRLRHPYCRPGLLLVCDYNGSPTAKNKNRVWLCGCDGAPRWELEEAFPVDAQLLSGNRVLINAAERDLQGKILRNAEWVDLVACQRLPNGNTFIACQDYVSEVTLAGKEIYTEQFLGTDIRGIDAAQNVGNGRIYCASRADGRLIVTVLDLGKRRPIKSIGIKSDVAKLWGFQVLASGHFLLAGPHRTPELGRILEAGPAGNIVRQWRLELASDARRLRGGNTLVACSLPGRVIEMDANGKIVWEAFSEGNSWRVRVCLGLVRFGFEECCTKQPDLANSVPSRINGLKSKDALVRRRSAAALAELGPKAEPALPALIDALIEPDKETRARAFTALAEIGPKAIPHIAKLLKAENRELRTAGARLIGRRCPESAAAIPDLLDALKDKDASVREAVVRSLATVGGKHGDVIAALVGRLQDQDAVVSQSAAVALGDIGAGARPAVPALLETLKGKDAELKKWSARALGQIGAHDPEVVRALINALKDEENAGVRLAGASALGRLGRAARQGVPNLVRMLKTENLDNTTSDALVETVATALVRIDPDGNVAVPALVTLLRADNTKETARCRAVEALAKMGQSAKQAIPTLKEIARSADNPLRDAALEALKRIGQGQ